MMTSRHILFAFFAVGFSSLVLACNSPSDFRNDAMDAFCKEQGLPAQGYHFDATQCKQVQPDTCTAVIAKLQQKGCKEGTLGHDRLFCCTD